MDVCQNLIWIHFCFEPEIREVIVYIATEEVEFLDS